MKIEQNYLNCWRRQSFWESYSKGANDAAQSLAVRRNKEAAVRDLFRKAVARLIPLQVNPLSPPPPSPYPIHLTFQFLFRKAVARLIPLQVIPHPPSHSFPLSIHLTFHSLFRMAVARLMPPSGHHLFMPADSTHML